MASEIILYICPRCCQTFDRRPVDHEHAVKPIRCDPGRQGDERRKPVYYRSTLQMTRAPRWYLEAIGLVSTR